MDTLNALGILELESGLDTAAQCHNAALEIAREVDDKAAQTNALDRLAVISCHRLEFDRALKLGERALELAHETGDEALVGRATDSIKLAVWQLGDLGRLEKVTAELERLWRERDDLWYLQFTLLESAFVPIGRARWDEAAERLAAADAINRRVHDPIAQVLILHARCWLHRSRGAYEDALSAGRQAVTVAPEAAWEGWAAETLGWTLLDLRSAAQAAEVLARGVTAAERVSRPNELVRCLGQLAWARWLLGEQDDALALATRGEELLGRVTAPDGGGFVFGAHAYAAIARVLLASGAAERGARLIRPVFEAAERAGWHEATAITGLVLGLCLEARDELDQARSTLARAAELSDEYGIPAPGWEAHAALARLVAADQHAAAAKAIVERMSAALKDEAQRDQLREQLSP
jgi:tetratricopeptide (TPR) repeat protein